MPIEYGPSLPPVPTGMTASDMLILREQLQEDTLQILLKYIREVAADGGVVEGNRSYWETHIQDWGAVADGAYDGATGTMTGTDNTGYIQAAIDHAIYNGFTKVIVDPGKYRTTHALHLGYGESFHSIVLEGSNYMYYAFGDLFCGAAILADFCHEMAINVQGARGSVIRGLAILGKLYSWCYTNTFCIVGTPPDIDDTDSSNWNGDVAFWAAQLGLDTGDPGELAEATAAAANIDARYAPYAGVTIDAYSGTRPGTSYPDVDYPPSTGIATQYGKAYSSDVLIEDCQISGFIAGIANQPCDADGNGDFTVIRRCNMDSCKYGISVCNTQSRNVSIMDVKYGIMHTMLTNCKHGRQNGKFNGAIINLSGGASIQVFDFSGTSITGPIEFTNLYAEAHWRVGTCTTGTAAETALRFKVSLMSFELQEDHRGIPAYILDGAGTPIDMSMVGCSWTNFRSVWATNHRVVADGCLFFNQEYAQSVTLAAYEQYATNFLCGGFFRPPTVPTADLVDDKIHFTQFNLDTGVRSINVETGRSYRYGQRTTCIPAYVRSTMPGNDFYRVEDLVPQQSGYALSKDSGAPGFFSAIDLTDRVLTLTCKALPNYLAHQYGLLPGDILWDQESGTVFFIRSRSGTTVIAEQQNNYKDDGAGGWECLTPFVTASAAYLYAMCTRYYTTDYSLLGTQTSGSAVITNAQTDDGYSGFIESSIAVGDALFINTRRDRRFPEDVGFVAGRSNAGQTVTLSGNAIYTADRLVYPHWIRTGPANRGSR